MSSVHNDIEHSVNRSNRKVAPIFVIRLSVRCIPPPYPAECPRSRSVATPCILRHIQNAHEVVVDFKLLRFAPAGALRLMNNNLFDKFIYNCWGEFLISVYLLHRLQKIGRAALMPLLRVNLRLQSGDFLFE